MKSMNRHLVTGALLCALTAAAFAAAYASLPEMVPVQFGLDGGVNSYMSRDVVAVGVPVLSVLLDVVAGARLAHDADERVVLYYVVPVIAWIVTGVTIVMS